MLQVKTHIKQSPINGIGLFASEFIAKGTTTWKYTPEFDLAFSEDCLSRMTSWSKEQFLKYAYFDHSQKKYILCFDDQRFINHSYNPNIKSTPELDVALIDINAGEELTCNYKDYEPDWFTRRNIEESTFK